LLTFLGLPPTRPRQAKKFIITPGERIGGRVASSRGSEVCRPHVPVGQIPTVDARMDVLPEWNQKFGEGNHGPQRDENTVADLISGDVEKGDEVRQK